MKCKSVQNANYSHVNGVERELMSVQSYSSILCFRVCTCVNEKIHNFSVACNVKIWNAVFFFCGRELFNYVKLWNLLP